jgi:hypothetical protein
MITAVTGSIHFRFGDPRVGGLGETGEVVGSMRLVFQKKLFAVLIFCETKIAAQTAR